MSLPHAILVINPGSTSTKIAVTEEDRITHAETLRHDVSELSRYERIWDQLNYRLMLCRHWSAARLEKCSAVVARGGLLRPLPGGTYRVTPQMLDDAKGNFQGEHASNLGCALVHGALRVLKGEEEAKAY